LQSHPEIRDIERIAETPMMLNGFLGECREGVGGIEVDREISADIGGSVGIGGGHVGKSVGVGGKSSGGARRICGGKGVESHEENGGKVWRFEAGSRNGGTGVDSSAEELGTKDIAGEGFGGVVRLEERTRVGTEEERGGLQGSCFGGRELHIDMFVYVAHRQTPHEQFIDSAFISIILIAITFVHDLPTHRRENCPN